jgi:hypothetical protein
MQNVVLVMLTPEELHALIKRAVQEALADQPAPAPAPPREVLGDYLTTKQAAEALGVSPKTLEAHRSRGAGPKYVRIGRAIRYPAATLTGPQK